MYYFNNNEENNKCEPPKNDYKYKLTIKDHINHTIKYAYSNHIVLSMNQFFRPIYNDVARYIVDSVTVSEVYKINLIFDSEWIDLFL